MQAPTPYESSISYVALFKNILRFTKHALVFTSLSRPKDKVVKNGVIFLFLMSLFKIY